MLCCLHLSPQGHDGQTSARSSDKELIRKSLDLVLSITRGRKSSICPRTKTCRRCLIILQGSYSLLYTHLSFIAISWCIWSNLPQTLMCSSKKLALVLILYSLFSSTSQNLTSFDLSILCSKVFDIKADCFHTYLSNIICFTSEYALARWIKLYSNSWLNMARTPVGHTHIHYSLPLSFPTLVAKQRAAFGVRTWRKLLFANVYNSAWLWSE